MLPRGAGSSVADLLALSASHLASLPVELASGGAGVSLLEEVVEDVLPVVVKPKRVRVAVGSKANKKTAITSASTTTVSTQAVPTTRPVTSTSIKSKTTTTTTTASATTTTTATSVAAASSKVSNDVYEEEEEEEDEEDPVYYQRDTVGDEYDEEYF